MSRKRPRIEVVTERRKRPIDKNLIFVRKAAVDATQVAEVLLTATFPCTITGLRWGMSVLQAAGTSQCEGSWAIVVEREGNVVDTLAITDSTSFYDPEQNVLAFGVWLIENNSETKQFEGSTKTMRKMQTGDTLQLLVKGVATETSTIRGVIQFFCMT